MREVGAWIERQGLTCTICGATYTSASAAAFCCVTEED